jgi:hypothetical protein
VVITDPLESYLRMFLWDEKNYIRQISRVDKVFMVPLTIDPKLKTKLSPQEV